MRADVFEPEDPAPAAPAPSRRVVHPIVKLNFGVRLVGHLADRPDLCLGAARPWRHGPGAWAFWTFTTLIWPFAAYGFAVLSADSKRTELHSLLCDSAFSACGAHSSDSTPGSPWVYLSR